MYPIPDSENQTGGVNISGTTGPVAGDIVGRDKNVNVTINDGTFLEERNESLERTVNTKNKHLIMALLCGTVAFAFTTYQVIAKLIAY
jgi:hypothetical protein